MRPAEPANFLGRGFLRVGYRQFHSQAIARDIESQLDEVRTAMNDQAPAPLAVVAHAPPFISPLCWRNRFLRSTV